MSGIVVDTSAVIALLFAEPGAAPVAQALAGPDPLVLSSVNLAETLTIAARKGMPVGETQADILALGFTVAPYDVAEASATSAVAAATRRKGISLGDAACLATAQCLGFPVLTADRAWAKLGLDLDIRLIR